jgi:hypothetical protein
MSEGDRVIAEVTDYDGFVAAIRQWIAALDTTHEAVGSLAGLPDRYLNTLLSTTPVKSFSRVSLAPTLSALGLRLQLVVDSERLAAMRSRYTARSSLGRKPAVSSMQSQQKTAKRPFSIFRGNPELAKMLHARWMLQSTPSRRKRIARAAALARWRNEVPAPHGTASPRVR